MPPTLRPTVQLISRNTATPDGACRMQALGFECGTTVKSPTA